jgi:hypothetical protein
MSEYSEAAYYFIRSNQFKFKAGGAIILIWNDKDHLKEWTDRKVENSKAVRVVSIPLASLPMLAADDRDNVCVVAVAFGKKEDRSDTVCVYHMITKKDDIPSIANTVCNY